MPQRILSVVSQVGEVALFLGAAAALGAGLLGLR
jgi:hypothetical protein